MTDEQLQRLHDAIQKSLQQKLSDAPDNQFQLQELSNALDKRLTQLKNIVNKPDIKDGEALQYGDILSQLEILRHKSTLQGFYQSLYIVKEMLDLPEPTETGEGES